MSGAQAASAGEVLPVMSILVAVLLLFALNMLGRALRPIKEILVAMATAGLAVLAIGAALVILVAAAVMH